MAVEFADGVVFGADSRTSTGTYVANRVTDKLTQVFVLFHLSISSFLFLYCPKVCLCFHLEVPFALRSTSLIMNSYTKFAYHLSQTV